MGRATALAVLAAFLLTASAQAQQAPAQVSAFPAPGSTNAARGSEVSFRGIDSAAVTGITARGLRSGNHVGRIIAHSDGRGASFVPARPFSPGETVQVTSELDVRGATRGDFSFTVADAPGRVDGVASPRQSTVDPGKTLSFETREDLAPPVVTITTRRPVSSGELLVAGVRSRKPDARRGGPAMYDERGRLVWHQPLRSGRQAYDVRVQRYRDKPVVTWIEGRGREGTLRIVDERYETVAALPAGNGLASGLHEFVITPRDTALITAHPVVGADLRSVGGPADGRLVDSVVQELDLATGRVLFEWHAAGTLSLRDSHKAVPKGPRTAFDPWEVGSVDQFGDGDLLVSARGSWSILRLDRDSAQVEWVLGGRSANLVNASESVSPQWQGDARWHAEDGTISVFDNRVNQPSRVMTVAVDETLRTARLVAAQRHPRELAVATGGNTTRTSDGGRFVGWGSQRYFSEFSPGGKLMFEGRFAVGWDSYRTYRAAWTGRPASVPVVVARQRPESGSELFVSWNGATEVARWEVLSGSVETALEAVKSQARDGFETRITLASRPRFVAIRALGRDGEVLGTSKPVPVQVLSATD